MMIKEKFHVQEKLIQDLLNELNALDYYKKSFPKSLGFEFVKEIVLPLIEKHSLQLKIKCTLLPNILLCKLHLHYQSKLGMGNY
jgi:hypothetical protein